MPEPRESLVQLARLKAAQFSLDPALVCAVVEQESGWVPWAWNPEPRYRHIVNVKNGLPFRTLTPEEMRSEEPPADFSCPPGVDRDTEWWGQQASWGLMQVMGAVARERGFKGRFLSELCEPGLGLEVGCEYLAHRLTRAHNDTRAALLRWNGGGNPRYPEEVLARMARYAATTTGGPQR